MTELLQQRNMDTTQHFEDMEALAMSVIPGTATHEEDIMLLKKHTLSQQAKRAFKLPRNPFDELSVQSSDDIFTTPDIRYVREVMFQTATYGGLLVV